MTVGLIVCVVVLAAASAFGFGWRRRNGVLRPAPRPGIPARAPSRGLRSRRSLRNGGRAGGLTEAQLEQPLGSRATLVQFSSAYCGPCHAARRILAEVAKMVDGVTHIEIDAEAHQGLARELGIVRTPTVFVLDRDGTIMRRGTGQPRKADVIAAVGLMVPGDTAAAGAGGAAG